MKTGRFSFPAIKSKPARLVNWTCTLLAVSFAVTMLSAVSNTDSNLPDINAKEYSARVERRSTSGRVYLLSIPNSGQQPPADGRIVLLKQGGVPVMAFRVLKDYPDKTEFAGKWLRRYGDVQQLSPGSQYDAFEKISDREPPALTRQDQKDLKEVEAAAPAPPPVPAVAPTPEVAAQAAPAPPSPPPLPVEPAPALPPTAPLTPEVAASAPPPVPPPTAEAAVTPPLAPAPPAAEESPAPAVAEAPTPPPPADLAGPQQVPAPAPTATDNVPAPGASPEAKPKGFDSDLDATTSPGPEASPDLNGDDMSSIMVEEVKHFDDDMNALSVGVGLYRNILVNDNGGTSRPISSTSIYNSAGTIRYSRVLAHLVHYKSKHLQDNLAIDGSLGFYKYLGITTNGDTYTVVPASLSLRYTLLPSEDFGFFIYGGFVENFVAQTINPDPNVQSGLSSFLPDIGIGMLFRIGPSWYMRGDAGLDLFEFSIALRF